MDEWEKFIYSYTPSTRHKHDVICLEACRLAWQAASLNTYGVGALLIDSSDNIIVKGHNQVHVGGYRSDLHAEMVVLNEFETGAVPENLDNYTLVSSLEPCPMCMVRIILAGVGRVIYIHADDIGGMVQRKASLPPFFKDLTEQQKQEWIIADCSDELRNAAYQIWYESHCSLHESEDR